MCRRVKKTHMSKSVLRVDCKICVAAPRNVQMIWNDSDLVLKRIENERVEDRDWASSEYACQTQIEAIGVVATTN